MPDDDKIQAEIESLKKLKEQLEAEKAVVDARKALEDAKTTLAQTTGDSNRQIADLKAQKELADAQKALADSQKALDEKKLADLTASLKAQKDLVDAQKALDKAKDPGTAAVELLQQQKAVDDARKDAAGSKTAAVEAQWIGDVKAGPYTGAVDLKEKAGLTEAGLLAAAAVNEAARKIAARVREERPDVEYYLFLAKEFPKFQRLRAFRFRSGLLRQAFDAANVQVQRAAAEERFEIAPAIPAVAAAGLDAFGKILGYFKTDYTVGGVEAKLDESLLLYAVSGELARRRAKVHLPMIYAPEEQREAIAALVTEMAGLLTLRGIAEERAREKAAAMDALQKQIAAASDAKAKADLQAGFDAVKADADRMKAVIALYDGFVVSLTSADAGGSIPLEDLANEFAIESALRNNGRVLLLRLESSGGSYFIEKNLWSALGNLPLYYMGGATVSFVLICGVDGQVLEGGTIPIHGGFVGADDLRRHLEELQQRRHDPE